MVQLASRVLLVVTQTTASKGSWGPGLCPGWRREGCRPRPNVTSSNILMSVTQVTEVVLRRWLAGGTETRRAHPEVRAPQFVFSALVLLRTLEVLRLPRKGPL